MGGERPDDAGAPADPQRLIAARLREVAAATSPLFEALTPERVSEWENGDIGRIAAGADLVRLPISSHRQRSGPAVVALKRTLRRLLHPLPETQSSVNAANARVATFLLGQLAAQARAIEQLESELAELRAQRQP
jgi:hypothetical protein